MKNLVTSYLLLLAIVLPLSSKDYGYLPEDPTFSKALGDFEAVLEDEDLLETNLEKIQALYEQKKTPKRRAYLGAMIAKQAVYSIFPWSKLSYANNGSKMLDKAVQKVPKEMTVRLVRLRTYINFPEFLGKKALVIQDYKLLSNYHKKGTFRNGIEKESLLSALAKFHIRYGDEGKVEGFYAPLSDEEKRRVTEFKEEFGR